MNKWTTDRIISLKGKRIVITGASHGIGYATAETLASKSADVVMAVRNTKKGEDAACRIREKYPEASVTVMYLDLCNLATLKQFASDYSAQYDRLDVLINNAGIMWTPYSKTVDGFELQFGTNHLGHFALTAHLLPLLMATPLSRVVTTTSIAARKAKIYFDNLDGSHGYCPITYYRQSKLANLLFGIELQHRFERAGATTISVLCHPGISTTNIITRDSGKEANRLIKTLMRIIAQPPSQGALSTLYAATYPDLRGGELIGPDRHGNTLGYPSLNNDATILYKSDLAARLWKVSEELTGVSYSI